MTNYVKIAKIDQDCFGRCLQGTERENLEAEWKLNGYHSAPLKRSGYCGVSLENGANNMGSCNKITNVLRISKSCLNERLIN